MTIALGILASNGVVLASDSEESSGYAGGLKNFAVKIESLTSGYQQGGHQSVLGVSGAGRSSYLDAIKQKITGGGVRPDGEDGEVQESIETTLMDFYAKHVIPFANNPDNDRPDFSLVIGRQWGNRYSLWSTDKTTVSSSLGFAAVGAGATFASILLGQMYRLTSMRLASAIAAYVVKRVKETIEGCGKETQIICLSNGHVWHPFEGGRDLDNIEDIFRRWEFCQMLDFHCLLGDPQLPKNQSAILARARRSLRKELAAYLSLPEQ